jgi:hypothetical protein
MAKKMTKTEWRAFLEQMRANAERTRQLAQRGQAELEKRKSR